MATRLKNATLISSSRHGILRSTLLKNATLISSAACQVPSSGRRSKRGTALPPGEKSNPDRIDANLDDVQLCGKPESRPRATADGGRNAVMGRGPEALEVGIRLKQNKASTIPFRIQKVGIDTQNVYLQTP